MNTIGFDFTAFIEEGQQARAEELAERLELAIDALLELKLQGFPADEAAKRDALFDLYEHEILTRGQVRDRGNLDPADFYEELQAYRQRQSAR